MVIVFLWLAAPSLAQCSSGVCPQIPSITLSTAGGEVHVLYYASGETSFSSSSIDVKGDGISFSVYYDAGSRPHINLNLSNAERTLGREKGHIYIGAYPSELQEDAKVVDLTALPAEYRDLWDRMRSLVGEIIAKDEFWQVIGTGADAGVLRGQLEKLRDGYMAPEIGCDVLRARFDISIKMSADSKPVLCRGYTLTGLNDLSIYTFSPWGASQPEVFVESYGNQQNGRWALDVNPLARTCTLSLTYADREGPVPESEWRGHVNEMMGNLEFFRMQIRPFVENGLIEHGDELSAFIDASLKGIEEYPIEFVLIPYRSNTRL
jgi:hypothetical protein